MLTSFAVLALVTSVTALSPSDFEIASLPGLDAPPTFKQYAGLLPINDGAGTELFFWFVESAKAPATDPLVFWTNGGPGASSVAFGFWTEHGPFRLENTTGGVRPVAYDYSWNRIANVLYVEMPTGVVCPPVSIACLIRWESPALSGLKRCFQPPHWRPAFALHGSSVDCGSVALRW